MHTPIKSHEIFASPSETAAVVAALRSGPKSDGVLAASLHRNRKTGQLGIIVKVASVSRAGGLAETCAEAGFSVSRNANFVVLT
jgi:hypothetical protein